MFLSNTGSDESVESNTARGSDSNPALPNTAIRSPKLPTDFSDFRAEIRKARQESANDDDDDEDSDSWDGLAEELENRVEAGGNSSQGSSGGGTANGTQPVQLTFGRGLSVPSEGTRDSATGCTDRMSDQESHSSDGESEVLHQTDGSNDSPVRRGVSRRMTITSVTVAAITKYSEESITSPFKELSQQRAIQTCTNRRSNVSDFSDCSSQGFAQNAGKGDNNDARTSETPRSFSKVASSQEVPLKCDDKSIPLSPTQESCSGDQLAPAKASPDGVNTEATWTK